MFKLVTLKIGNGSFDRSFYVSLQIGEENYQPELQITGTLPALSEIIVDYQRWQTSYERLGNKFRLGTSKQSVNNVSSKKECQDLAAILAARFNHWLLSEEFRPIREKFLEKLTIKDEIKLIIQADNPDLYKLPWQLWEILERYPLAEIAYSLPTYERANKPNKSSQDKVKIIAIFGDSTGIDVEADRKLLADLPHTDIYFLTEPTKQELSEKLWQKWDILFFAGHSFTKDNIGQIFINKNDVVTIAELKHILKKTVSNGLQIAIFNSCDGLGVAREFALLHIPQIILFKEPVPDPVAQTFLAYFLESFANGQSLYLSVREARERLQALENKFPCASWLPLIFQNPAETSITWQALLDGNFQQKYLEPKVKQEKTHDLLPKKSLVWLKIISSSTLSTIIITAIRLLGLLESLELQSFDWYLASKRAEQVDSRIVIVTIDEEDIKQQNIGKSSLADRALKQILEKIAPYQPRAIGLDVYRDFSSRDRDLKKNLAENQNLIAICKVSDPIHQVTGIEAPPEIPIERQGFSDFLEDEDGVVRRQLMFFNPDPASNCQASYALSLQLAFRYLLAEGIAPTYTSEGNLQLGSITIPLLKSFTGGYQNLDARGGQILLNYRQNIRPFSRISLRHFLSKDFNPEVLRDRLLLIGVTAYSNNDYWNTPWGKNPTQRQAGVLIHAHMTSQILSHVLDKRPLIWVWSFPIEIIWLSFWSLLASIFAARLVRLSRLLLGGGFLLATIYLICWLTFFQAGWLPLFPAILVVLLSLSLSKSFSFFDR